MANPELMDLERRQRADRKLAEARQEALKRFEYYSESEAFADEEYLRERAKRIHFHEQDGSATNAKAKAEGDVSELKRKRDVFHSRARAALLRIDEVERNAVSVRDMHASSERVEGLTT